MSVRESLLEEYRNLLTQRRYSEHTKKIYCNYFDDFCIYFKDQNPEQISTEQINSYLLSLVQNKNISASQQNQRINAIKFYYEKILGKEKQYFKLHRPIREHKLPDFEFYDLQADPIERRNLSGNPEVSDDEQRLRNTLEDYLLSTSDPILDGPVPAPPGYWEHFCAKPNGPGGLPAIKEEPGWRMVRLPGEVVGHNCRTER